MKKAEINALEIRFKATFLLLMNCGIDEVEEIDKGITIAHKCFDGGYFEECKKALDLVDAIVADILEAKLTDNLNLN